MELALFSKDECGISPVCQQTNSMGTTDSLGTAGGKTVRQLLFAAAILVCAAGGCASTGDSSDGSWEPFWKDLRGDNMQMRSNFGTSTDNKDMGGSLKPSYF